MAETFRRSKIERIVKMLEAEISDFEANKESETNHGMILYYSGMSSAQRSIIARLKREFKLKEEKANESIGTDQET